MDMDIYNVLFFEILPWGERLEMDMEIYNVLFFENLALGREVGDGYGHI